MKKTELVKRLEKSILRDGDGHLRFVKLVSLEHGEQTHLLSPTRTDKNGSRSYMNQKEFVEYCKNNPVMNKKEIKESLDKKEKSKSKKIKKSLIDQLYYRGYLERSDYAKACKEFLK